MGFSLPSGPTNSFLMPLSGFAMYVTNLSYWLLYFPKNSFERASTLNALSMSVTLSFPRLAYRLMKLSAAVRHDCPGPSRNVKRRLSELSLTDPLLLQKENRQSLCDSSA